MINKVTNECNISGKLYGFGRFGLKKDEKDGKIRGSITVLTDAETQNVVEINFLPQSPTYKSGKDNNNYSVLEQIIEEEKIDATEEDVTAKIEDMAKAQGKKAPDLKKDMAARQLDYVKNEIIVKKLFDFLKSANEIKK